MTHLHPGKRTVMSFKVNVCVQINAVKLSSSWSGPEALALSPWEHLICPLGKLIYPDSLSLNHSSRKEALWEPELLSVFFIFVTPELRNMPGTQQQLTKILVALINQNILSRLVFKHLHLWQFPTTIFMTSYDFFKCPGSIITTASLWNEWKNLRQASTKCEAVVVSSRKTLCPPD